MLNRRTLLAAVPVALAATRLPRPAAAQDAAALLEQAAATMTGLSSFHFELTVPKGTSTFGGVLELDRMVGDVLRPDSFRADVTAKTSLFSITVHVVGIGTTVWVTNPMSSGEWQEFDGADAMSDLPAILNPDRLILLAVQLIQNPAIAGTESIGDRDATRIDGQFKPGELTAVEGTPVPMFDDFPADRVLDVSIWIDAENRVPRVDFKGPFTDSDSGDVVRRLDVTAFNEPVTIEPPV